MKSSTNYAAKIVRLRQSELKSYFEKAEKHIKQSQPSVAVATRPSNADFVRWSNVLRGLPEMELDAFFKNYLRGINSSELEADLRRRFGAPNYEHPYVETYDVTHALQTYGTFTTSDDIVVSCEGSKFDPANQVLVLTQGNRTERFNDYVSAEFVGAALAKFRK